MGYIYKVTNKINGKQYIGKTTKTIEDRWKGHIEQSRDLNRNYHFMLAIRKWGPDNFIVEQVEECDDSLLNEREHYWITYYNTYYNGYNSTLGGEGVVKINREEVLKYWNEGWTSIEIASKLNASSSTINAILRANHILLGDIKNRSLSKKVEQYDLQGNYIKTYSNKAEASKETGISEQAIQHGCTTNGFSSNYFWKYAQNSTSIEELIEQYKNNKNISKGRPVDQYDFNGNYLKTWRSATEAAEEYNCAIQNILRSCSHYRESARGYLWTYSDSNEDMNKRCNDYINKTDPRGIGVRQYDLEGNFLHYYPSLSEAARENNIEHTALQKAFRNRYTSGGYVWLESGEEDEWLDKIIQRNKTKHDNKKKIIQQYDLNDNFIAEYPAAKDAAAAIGFPDKWRNLQRVCQGYQKTCCGFKWKYKI